MKRTFLLISAILVILNLSNNSANCQDAKYARNQLHLLCGPEMHGRGYYNRGDSIAAFYIAAMIKVFPAAPCTYDKLPLYAYQNLFKLVVAIPEELKNQEMR